VTVKYFNVKTGLTTGNILLDAGNSNITANTFIGNLSVTNIANLGNVGNVKISGGTNGYVLSTDGSGNLSWEVGDTLPGGTNTQVQFNDASTFGGNSAFTFNKTTGTLSSTIFSGAGNALSNIQGANVSGQVAYSNVANNVAGANVLGQVGNALVAGTVYTNAQPNITSTGTLTSVSVSGNANIGNIGTGGLITATGNISGGNLNTGGVISATGNANVGNLGTAGLVTATGNIIGGNLTTSGILSVTGTGVSSINGNLNMNSQFVVSVSDPVNLQDVATKNYVDIKVTSGISYHQPVQVATTTTLAIATGGTTAYNSPNGAANGIGAYISTTGTFNLIDTANVQTVDTRILVKDEANATWNGVYTYANTTAIVRSTDTDEYGADSVEAFSINDYFYTQNGTVNKGVAFVVSAPSGTITFGTSNITFSIFSSSQVYSAGTGIAITGTTISANASQTQITAVGTLTTLSVSGNANIGNIGTGGIITATGTATVGNLATGGTLSAGGNANVGNLGVTGVFATTLSATGNANAGNIGATQGIFTNVSGNGSTLSSITGANVTGAVAFATTANAVAGANVTGEVSFAATANAVAGANVSGAVTYAATANAVAGANVSGAVAFATTANSVAGANVSGQVGNALVAGTVYTNAQPNITSTGTLASLSVSGNATVRFVVTDTGANITGTLSATGNANVGNIGATNIVGTLSTASQTNITSTGTLASLSVSGNANVGNIGTAGQFISSVITGTAPMVVSSTTQVANLNATTAGTVYTNAQPNITSTGTLASLSVSGNANVGNIGATNIVGTLSTASQPNITSTGTLASLSVSGNATVGNIIGPLASGNSNISITANSNIAMTVAGTSNIMILTATGANITGSLSVSGNVSTGGAILPRVVSITDGTSVTINGDTTDIATQTNTQVSGTLTINAPTGTPFNGQKLIFRLQSSNIQTFSWNAVFAGSTDLSLPTTSSGSSKYDYVGFIYNTPAINWQLLAKNFGF